MIILSVGRWFERSDNLDDLNYFVIIILGGIVILYCCIGGSGFDGYCYNFLWLVICILFI